MAAKECLQIGKCSISEFGVVTAHSNDAFCVEIKVSISKDCIVMEIFILTQNALFECADNADNAENDTLPCNAV